jgi:gamma-glutamyltranspeptidase / glutathione hydrolase
MGQRSQWLIDKSEAIGDGGMVTAMHPLAAEAGASILKRGGNAIDAAIATAFAVGVVEPHNSGVGGIAFLAYSPGDDPDATYCLDGTSVLPKNISPEEFEVLPGNATAGMYRWPATKDDANNTGWRSPAVPGMPALMGDAHKRFGKLPWSDLLQPAIKLARDGFEIDVIGSLAITMAHANLSRFPSSRAIYLTEAGGPLMPSGMLPGDRVVQTELAWTLEQIAEKGPDALYTGEVGKRLAAQMEKNGGLITEDDLAAHRTLEHTPTTISYKDFTVTAQIENSGNATVLQALKILEGLNLSEHGFQTPTAAHLTAEAIRRAFRDRLRYLGDAEQMTVPYQGVISAEYAAERRKEIDPERATPDAGPGDPWPYDPQERPADDFRDSSAPGGRTTHLNVIDGDGNMVSMTSTLGSGFGSCVVVPETGILLNNATTWFDPRPGAVTSVGPGKRILSAASPMLIRRNGKPFAAIGAPGGRRIISAMTQVAMNLMEYGAGMQESISAPRMHTEGPLTEVSERFGPQVLDHLKSIGQKVASRTETINSGFFARPSGIRIDPETGKLHGGVFQYTAATAIAIDE